MAKMSAEDKLAAVQRYVNGNESSRTVAADTGISHRYLLSLVKQYEHNGVEAFVRRYTNYTKVFKLDVLNYMAEHGTSFNETAAIFQIAGASSIQNWKKQLETQGEDALQSKKKGRPSMKKETAKQSKKTPVEGSTEALQARIKQLEMENEYLKKLNALVQAKEKSPRKTK
jgi:transposase